MNYVVKDLIEQVRDNGELEELADAMSVQVDAIPMCELEFELSQMSGEDAFRLGMYSGEFNWGDNYFAYDGYANIYTLSDSQYEDMLFNEILNSLCSASLDDLREYDSIETIGDYFEEIDSITSQIEDESYTNMRQQTDEAINSALNKNKSLNERVETACGIRENWWNNATDSEKIGAYWYELFNHEFMYNWDIEFDIKQCLPIEKELFAKAYSMARRYANLTMEI